MSLTPYQHLEKRFKRVHILRTITHLLRWDAEVMMPQDSTDLRSQQLSLLDTETSSILYSIKTAKLLDMAESSAGSLNAWQQANLKEMRRILLHSNAIPKRLIRSLQRAVSKAEMRWRQAREENNFALFAPHLEKVIELVKEKSLCLSEKSGLLPYDTLIDEHDPGGRTCEIDTAFHELEQELAPLIPRIIKAQTLHPPKKITAAIPVAKQIEFGKWLMNRIGFPFNNGRIDESLHPFTEGTAEDIRITSRFSEHDFLSGLMGILHETGHAMYDFGLPPEWSLQPVGRDRGMTIHEGQALFLEMFIGRSREFLQFAAPHIAEAFEVSGPDWEPENLYRLTNQVKPSFIRMDADEVTYPMHILLRYELERELLSGSLAVKHLPEAWNEKSKQKLGIVPEQASQGCLQDSHWAAGYFGYFPTYVLGAMTAAQLFQAMIRDEPDMLEQSRRGDFSTLFHWMGQKVYLFGAKLSRDNLLEQATGEKLNSRPLLDYIKKKYLV